MRTYIKDGVQMVTVKGQITDVAEYKTGKSLRFDAKTDDLDDISGFIATSLEVDLVIGATHTFSCEMDILLGTADSLKVKEPTNWLWSISRGSASPLTDQMLTAIRALKA